MVNISRCEVEQKCGDILSKEKKKRGKKLINEPVAVCYQCGRDWHKYYII